MSKEKKTATKKPARKAARVPVKKSPVKKGVKKNTAAAGKKAAPKKAAKKKALSKKSAKKTAGKPKRRKPETLMCFLTSACVEHYGLPDNGYELNTLRNYRDNYLAASPGGQALIQDYYRISPEIVKRVNKDPDKNSLYAYIYAQVTAACAAIRHKQLLSAKQIYLGMVKTLMKKYSLN